MGREFELKYGLTEAAKEEIRKKYGSFRTISMETTYYDTPARSLSAQRWTLRRRLENGVSVCTLKTPLPDGSKGEWETVCKEIAEALPALIALGAPNALTEQTASGLKEICGARFTRLAGDVTFGESRLELALDEGFLFRKGNQQKLLELEVELKEGRDEDAVTFAQILAAKYGLHPENKSKFKRAMEL